MILLMILHHIADVAFQPGWLIRNKCKNYIFAHYEHAFVWAGMVSFGLFWLDIFTMWKFVFLLVGHGVIDYTKYKYFKDYRWVYVDQLLHYLQLYIVWAI